jgi:stalled ribosome alternative rescue factor ArfA
MKKERAVKLKPKPEDLTPLLTTPFFTEPVEKYRFAKGGWQKRKTALVK